ncbi:MULTISPECIES: hypothetical protein [Actinoalloteichus]|uniref:Uncharacterized protein n=1 Tax=Actinoalloteichus fjordicus TaxID=1612552 RepID=A0AAC9PTL9_9PSEU|nr:MULTISPECIES: hypothetical protein [Actinoalloteichus]APU16819.1 hypothetical protein UA74_24005 [Actinoalloteichus fjordicus]APU22884.1 hypothetical protein UA75_24510 [Actinoalloteichus sp. GBA129-24]
MSTRTAPDAPTRVAIGPAGSGAGAHGGSDGLDLTELRADLLATAVVPGPTPEQTLARTLDDPGWVVRPSLLRRAAEVLARELPRSVDRVIAPRPADAALATAVSLHTGLPFAVLGTGAAIGSPTSTGTEQAPSAADAPVVILGEVHGLETVALIGAVPAPARFELESWVARQRLTVARWSTLLHALS